MESSAVALLVKTINFDENKLDYQRKNISKKDLLAKAVGVKTQGLRVLDLTAGLGIDDVHLAQLGCKILSLERNSILYSLLHQAWQSSVRPEIKNIQFQLMDAKDYLLKNKEGIAKDFDVIYYDPMYPEKKKSALPRKEMQVFRELVGNDLDADEIIELVLATKIKRFVVKRPKRSRFENKLEKGQTLINFEGTTIQYQVFIQGK